METLLFDLTETRTKLSKALKTLFLILFLFMLVIALISFYRATQVGNPDEKYLLAVGQIVLSIAFLKQYLMWFNSRSFILLDNEKISYQSYSIFKTKNISWAEVSFLNIGYSNIDLTLKNGRHWKLDFLHFNNTQIKHVKENIKKIADSKGINYKAI